MKARLKIEPFSTWQEANSRCAELDKKELEHSIFSDGSQYFVAWAEIA